MSHSFTEALQRAISEVAFVEDLAKADSSHQAREVARELEAALSALRKAEQLARRRAG